MISEIDRRGCHCRTEARQIQAVFLAFAFFVSTVIRPIDAGFFSRLASLGLSEEDMKKEEITMMVQKGVAYGALWDNNAKVPLIGYGVVTHFDAQNVPTLVAEAVQDDKRTRLFDTSPISGTETLVADGILKGVENMRLTEKLEVHVVTKVWYTHLGYGRTKLSVEDSLRAFEPLIKNDKVDVKIHFLLHWPRCFDNIHFMNCKQEEANLPQRVKDAGPDPALNSANAWKDSWKMLEEIYFSKQYPIESIGVANFRLQDLEEFNSFAKVKPSMIQLNLWALIYDHQLIRYCHENKIHVQVYNIMQQTLSRPEVAPHAYHHIQKVAVDISAAGGINYTPAQILFAWLVQHGVSIVPGTSKLDRVTENSAVSIMSIPTLNNDQVEALAHAVEAYLSGIDMELDTPVLVTFQPTTKDIMVYWLHDIDEIKLGLVRVGEAFKETTYPGHIFRFYDAKNKDLHLEHQVQANVGSHVKVYIDLAAYTMNVESAPYGGDDEL